ncbi:MAG: hypothetical protein D3X82_13855 [Candidatus Leucobacter sulfamidivorax]|nr:hypothetical protein [Candidatus Leucobacter sulfamidivorax]
MTTRRDLNELSALGSRAVELARAELEAFFYGLDLSKPELARDALLEFMPMLAQEYGDVAATAAAEWYEAQRFAQIGGSYQAVLADTVSVGQTQGSVRYAAGHLFGDDPSQTLALLSGAMQRFVLYGARDTIARNVGRDSARPRFARVPTGAKTCAWCTMLASRGFVYLTRETAGIARDHYHDDCDCQVIADFSKDAAHIEGYDPDGMYDMYLAARQAAGSGDQKMIAAEMRRMFPESFTDGVAGN